MLSKLACAAATLVLLNGCAAFNQTDSQVFVREPGQRFLTGPHPVLPQAQRDWQFALISEAAYRRSLSRGRAFTSGVRPLQEETTAARIAEAEGSACADVDLSLAEAGWQRWMNFPDVQLESELENSNLRAEVWENAHLPAVVVGFGGTVFTSGKDWKSNLRWFLPIRDDEYTALVTRFAPAFASELARRTTLPNNEFLREAVLYSTGHSLGGGLAQQFAYAMPVGPGIKRVSRVYAFDPSPVTGFYSVDVETRDGNKVGLEIERIYERGEALAALRSFTSLFYPPSSRDPTVRGVRYNFVYPFNPITNHSMLGLACRLQAIVNQGKSG